METFFLLYDPEWFRHLVKIVINIFALSPTYFIYKVFPFSFNWTFVNEAVFITLIVAMAAIVIGIIVELTMLLMMLKKRFIH